MTTALRGEARGSQPEPASQSQSASQAGNASVRGEPTLSSWVGNDFRRVCNSRCITSAARCYARAPSNRITGRPTKRARVRRERARVFAASVASAAPSVEITIAVTLGGREERRRERPIFANSCGSEYREGARERDRPIRIDGQSRIRETAITRRIMIELSLPCVRGEVGSPRARLARK